jgi:hypothetical protein
MTHNEAVRSQIKVMMADGTGAGETDVLVNEIVGLVFDTIGIQSPKTAGVASTPALRDRRLSARAWAAIRAAGVVEQLEPLTAVADAAERYRKAVRKGKGTKKAQKQLFESIEAWKKARAAPTAPV